MLHIIVAYERIHHFACCFVNERCTQFDMLVEGISHSGFDIHGCQFLGYVWSSDMCTPYRYIYLWFLNQVYIAKESCARVPTATLFAILQPNSNFVFSFLKCLCNITMKGIVTVRPEADFLSIDKYFRLTHCSIEEKEISPL